MQLLNLVVKGYELEDLGVRGGVRVTTHAKEGLLEDIPFGEAAGLAEDFILGYPEILKAGISAHDAKINGKKEVFVVIRSLGIAAPATYNPKFKEGLPEPFDRVVDLGVPRDGMSTVPIQVPWKDVTSGLWVKGLKELNDLRVVSQPLRDIVDGNPEDGSTVLAEAYVTLVNPTPGDVETLIGAEDLVLAMPDSTDLVAYTESQRRGYSAACVAARGDNRRVGLMLDANGERILSVRS